MSNCLNITIATLQINLNCSLYEGDRQMADLIDMAQKLGFQRCIRHAVTVVIYPGVSDYVPLGRVK